MENKIMKRFFYSVSITLVSLVACTRAQELDIPEIQEDGFTIIAKTEAPAETRTVVESGAHVYWEPGDEIAVFSGDKRGRFVTDLTTTSGTAAFKDVQEDESWADVNDIWALYPFSGDATFDGETITTVMPWRQVAREDSFGKDMNIAIAHNPSGNTLQFYNVGGGIRFSLSKEGIKEVELVGQKGEILAGNIKIGFKEGVPTIQEVTDGQPWVVVTPPNGETFKKDTWYYIITIPQVLENGFYLEFRDGNQYNDFFYDKSVIIKRSIYGSLTHAESIHEKQLALEREALIDLYNATDGDHWKNNTNWCSDLPVGQWEGVWTDVHGRVYHLHLSANGLNGTIPESIGNLVNLTYLNLGHNYEITGPIPESIGNLVNLKVLMLAENKLTGTIPETIMNIAQLDDFAIYQNRLDGILSEKLYYSDWWISRYFRMDQQDGYGLVFENIYESTDFSRDGEVKYLQKHTKGPGIPIVITADGFSDRMYADGYFDKIVTMAVEAFFDEEPYRTFRDYFDVYSVAAVSKNELIAYDLAFETRFSDWGPSDGIQCNENKVNEYILKVPELHGNSDNAVGILLVNKNNGCVAPFAYPFFENGYALCVIGVGDWGNVKHEAGGHGFGKLADEYYRNEPYTGNLYEECHQYGWYLNIDDTNDPTQVLWKDFLNVSYYQNEGIGIYQGALFNNLYKSTRESIMLNGINGFNPPSRWAIFQRIKKLAGEDYTFEDFLNYDKNRNANLVERRLAHVYNNINEKPPIIIHSPSSEARIQ
jgi:hypothetical protein